MKKLIMLPLLAGLIFSAGSLAAETWKQDPANPLPPVFSLEDSPQDSPALARKKASLRLFKAYGVTLGQLAACRSQAAAETDKALQGFTSRNGNTLATIMTVIKQHGGLTPDIKSTVNSAIAKEVAQKGDCRALVRAVADGRRDIYKAPQYLDDYKLIRSKP